ncbi:coth protein-domain-containing protein [Parasitella parasitica]|nr:coth protein-domain-containing protein [Parasitella parasitica]
MKFSLFTLASCMLISAEAASVTFNVVSPNAEKVQVKVNGKTTTLEAPIPNVPFFNGTVDVSSESTYTYISDGKSENFDRDLPDGRSSTFNDFYGRPITVADIPALPRPLDNNKEWARAYEDPDLFDTNYIPSIFVIGDSQDMNTLIKDTPKDQYIVDLAIVARDYVETFTNVSLSISGAGKKHNPAKQSWRWTLSPGEYINGRNNFKIRHMEEDPTQMREKLYADCLRAMGTYANQANMVRYFINGQGFGTFTMLDDVKDYSYIRSVFYNGKPPKQMGPLFDGSSGAGFQYISDPYSYGNFKPTPGSPEGSEAIYPLAKAFHELDVKNDKDIKKFEEMFDVDQFLRFMVMEYLGGSWDGYWAMQTNDGAYKDYASNDTWYYLGQDYDGTFGVNLPVDPLNWPYQKYISNYSDAVLINGLLKNQNLADTFETYIQDTVKELFNNDTLGTHITAYRKFIAPDIEWDRSIKQLSPGINYGWTYDQSYENLFEEVVAPNKNGGGAQYGLTEWIAKKSKVVAKTFKFSL